MKNLIMVCLVLSVMLTGCPHNTPPCDKVTLATIVAECKDKADCHAKIEQRERECGQRIIEGDKDAGAAGNDGGVQ